MSRTDDQINVSAHRLSTSSIEQAIVSHPLVAECAVVGIPDDLKGHMPFAFVTLASSGDNGDSNASAEKLFRDVDQQVRRDVPVGLVLHRVGEGHARMLTAHPDDPADASRHRRALCR